jgi:hypothetical protein
MLVFQPLNAGAAKPHPGARAKTVLSRCLLEAVIAPGLPREPCNRGRWASVSGHALVPRTDALRLQPLPTIVLCRVSLALPASSSFLLESAASVPLVTLRREWAGARCQRLAAGEIRSPLTPPLTFVSGGCRRCNLPERGNMPIH